MCVALNPTPCTTSIPNSSVFRLEFFVLSEHCVHMRPANFEFPSSSGLPAGLYRRQLWLYFFCSRHLLCQMNLKTPTICACHVQNGVNYHFTQHVEIPSRNTIKMSLSSWTHLLVKRMHWVPALNTTDSRICCLTRSLGFVGLSSTKQAEMIWHWNVTDVLSAVISSAYDY
jgi:hypothetical protein